MQAFRPVGCPWRIGWPTVRCCGGGCTGGTSAAAHAALTTAQAVHVLLHRQRLCFAWLKEGKVALIGDEPARVIEHLSALSASIVARDRGALERTLACNS